MEEIGNSLQHEEFSFYLIRFFVFFFFLTNYWFCDIFLIIFLKK